MEIWVCISGVSAGRNWRNWIIPWSRSSCGRNAWVTGWSLEAIHSPASVSVTVFGLGSSLDTLVDSSLERKRVCITWNHCVQIACRCNRLVRWIAALWVPLIYVMFALTFISACIADGIVVFASEIMYRTWGFKLTALSSLSQFVHEPYNLICLGTRFWCRFACSSYVFGRMSSYN
jgi:hypothetical protein